MNRVIRLSRLADYGIVVMTHLARHPDRQQTAPEIAAQSHLPLPTASKILKSLVRAGVLVSHRGVKGGYGLARPALAISVADVIVALDGPIALTACVEHGPGDCDIEALCPARANWQRINDAIRHALEGITMAEMAHAVPAAFAMPLEVLADRPIAAGTGARRRAGWRRPMIAAQAK
jgi:FeS assembly SUF system regulator